MLFAVADMATSPIKYQGHYILHADSLLRNCTVARIRGNPSVRGQGKLSPLLVDGTPTGSTCDAQKEPSPPLRDRFCIWVQILVRSDTAR